LLSEEDKLEWIEEYLILSDEDIEAKKLTLKYKGAGACEENSEGNTNHGLMHITNFYSLAAIVWLMMIFRWAIVNKFWFFRNHDFFAYRMWLIYVIKFVQCLMMSLIIILCYYPHERMMYMHSRSLFELWIWGSIVCKHIAFGIIISIFYSISKDQIFAIDDKMDDIYVLWILVIPLLFILGSILSFILINELFYIHFALVVYVSTTIILKASKNFLKEWQMRQRIRSYVFGGWLIGMVALSFWECQISYERAAYPKSRSLEAQVHQTMFSESLLAFICLCLFGLLNKNNALSHLAPQEIVEEIIEDEEQIEMEDFEEQRRAKFIKVLFPRSSLAYKEEVEIPRKLLKNAKPEKVDETSLEEEKDMTIGNKLDESHKYIFGCYSDSNGDKFSAEMYDYRTSSQYSEETKHEENILQGRLKPIDLYKDAYNGKNPIAVKKLRKRQLPVCIINPEYFFVEDNTIPSNRVINYDAISLIAKK